MAILEETAVTDTLKKRVVNPMQVNMKKNNIPNNADFQTHVSNQMPPLKKEASKNQ
jgi:hypothetical protein